MTIAYRRVIPVLRIFSIDKAREFYVGWLGCTWDWEHRFESWAPLYAQVSRGDLVLHLSEHHGDACPGSTAVVQMTGIAAFHREISAKQYAYNRPGLETMPWGTVCEVIDPFGNRLRFTQPTPA